MNTSLGRETGHILDIISVVFKPKQTEKFCFIHDTEKSRNEPKMKLLKTWKCLTVIERAEMGLHGTFGNLHTYLLFRAVQLQSVSGAVSAPAAPKPLPSPSALLGGRGASVKWLLIPSPICPAQSLF